MIISTAFNYAALALPKHCKHRTKRTAKFVLRALVYQRYFRQMVQLFGQGERLELLSSQQRFMMKCMVPFLHIGMSKQQIVSLLASHYQWMEGIFPLQTRQQLSRGYISLYQLDITDTSYQITLAIDSKFRKEGELALSIRDMQGNKLYSTAFTYQDRVFYIGCVQGSRHDNGFSQRFTKAMYGLRPKQFLIETLRLLAQDLGITALYGIKNESHIYNAKRFHGKASRFNLNYNQLWEELGGTSASPWLYSIPLIAKRRAMETVKRSRRKTYRQRYEWLDQYQQQLHLALKGLCREVKLSPKSAMSPWQNILA